MWLSVIIEYLKSSIAKHKLKTLFKIEPYFQAYPILQIIVSSATHWFLDKLDE